MRNVITISSALVLLVSGSLAAAAMSKDEYRDARKRIDAGYQAERQKCGERHGNSADLCIARAHGTRDVARAELEAAYKPGKRTNYDAAIARAQAAYAIAKEECDDRKPEARKECARDAKAAQARAQAEAKALRDSP